MAIEIYRDSKVVKVLAAEARKENIDSAIRAEAEAIVKDLAKDPSPHNLHMMAQLVKFGVSELLATKSNYIDMIADTKRIAVGDDAAFEIKIPGINAVVQAKNSTTPRSKNGRKQIVLDTVEVSARPAVKLYELQSGKVNMSDMIIDAAGEMDKKKLELVEQVLLAGAANWAAPYYSTGAGLVAATLDPMVQHWMRTGGAAIVGDIAIIQRLAELSGFVATTNTQFSEEAINAYHRTGHIGFYKGATVHQLVNPYDVHGNPVLDINAMYVLPAGADAASRPLKYVEEGDVYTIEATNIDDVTFEVRLGQYVGAGLAVGNTPAMSVYVDSSN